MDSTFLFSLTVLSPLYYVHHSCDSLQNGHAIILELLDEPIVAELLPVLQLPLAKIAQDYNPASNAKQQQVMIGTKLVSCHPDAKLYITTKLAYPQVSDDVLNNVNVIRYTISQESISHEICARILKHEGAAVVSNEYNTVVVQEKSPFRLV